jgi:hypothetical protein
MKPDLDDAGENAKRRALLFPSAPFSCGSRFQTATEWYEMEIKESNLEQVRVFPRAQWRRLARGNFSYH